MSFSVLLACSADGARAAAMARKFLAPCEKTFVLAGTTARNGVSGGTALFSQHGESSEVLSRHADAVMYAARRSERERFCLYTHHGHFEKTPASAIPRHTAKVPARNALKAIGLTAMSGRLHPGFDTLGARTLHRRHKIWSGALQFNLMVSVGRLP